MKLSKLQKENIRQILTDDRFRDVWIVIGELVDKWKTEEVWGASEFETLKNLGLRDGKIAGVDELMKNLNNEAISA